MGTCSDACGCAFDQLLVEDGNTVGQDVAILVDWVEGGNTVGQDVAILVDWVEDGNTVGQDVAILVDWVSGRCSSYVP